MTNGAKSLLTANLRWSELIFFNSKTQRREATWEAKWFFMKTFLVPILFVAICLAGCAADHPRLRVLTAVPKFEKSGDGTDLIVDDGKTPISIFWSWEPQDRELKSYPFFPITLATNTPYTFFIEERDYSTLQEEGLSLPHGLDPKEFMHTRRTLARISCNGAVLYDQAVCEIHHRKMQRINAHVIYGLIAPRQPAPTYEETHALFPHHETVSFGGCVVGGKKYDQIFVCPDCKAAYEKWEKDHPITTNNFSTSR